MQFEIAHRDARTKARTGLLTTAHGVIPTPMFMPVGTQATVKSLTPRELRDAGAKIVLANAYHLYLRPGTEIVSNAGGIHRFANWDGAVLTDSGGFQVYSLADLRKTSDDGVFFKSHLDGSKHFFDAEKVIEIEREIGADIIMMFDECPPSNAPLEVVRQATERSTRWAKRGMERFCATSPKHGYHQSLFPIVQGGVDRNMREACAKELCALDAEGYAIGGLAVGEPNEVMYEVAGWVTDVLPTEKPRYLMGVGTPVDLLEAIERGVDLFDCVLPTRNARNGQLFTRTGKINIRNAKWKRDNSPIDAETVSSASQDFTKSYLAHLFNTNEILGLTLATMHNIAFYEQLMSDARIHIAQGDYSEWKRVVIEDYKNTALTQI